MKSSTLGIVAWVVFGTGAASVAVGSAWMAGGPPESIVAAGVVLAVTGVAVGVAKMIRDDEETKKGRS